MAHDGWHYSTGAEEAEHLSQLLCALIGQLPNEIICLFLDSDRLVKPYWAGIRSQNLLYAFSLRCFVWPANYVGVSGRYVIIRNTEVGTLNRRLLDFAPAVESSRIRVFLHDTYANVTYFCVFQTVNSKNRKLECFVRLKQFGLYH